MHYAYMIPYISPALVSTKSAIISKHLKINCSDNYPIYEVGDVRNDPSQTKDRRICEDK